MSLALPKLIRALSHTNHFLPGNENGMASKLNMEVVQREGAGPPGGSSTPKRSWDIAIGSSGSRSEPKVASVRPHCPAWYRCCHLLGAGPGPLCPLPHRPLNTATPTHLREKKTWVQSSVNT